MGGDKAQAILTLQTPLCNVALAHHAPCGNVAKLA